MTKIITRKRSDTVNLLLEILSGLDGMVPAKILHAELVKTPIQITLAGMYNILRDMERDQHIIVTPVTVPNTSRNGTKNLNHFSIPGEGHVVKPTATPSTYRRLERMEAVLKHLCLASSGSKFSVIMDNLNEHNIGCSSGNLSNILMTLLEKGLVTRKRQYITTSSNHGSTGYFYKVTSQGHKAAFVPLDVDDIVPVQDDSVSTVRQHAFGFMMLTCDRGKSQAQDQAVIERHNLLVN